jgi:hypothetical protein
MKSIYLESVKTHLTMAVLLRDELSPDKKVIGDIFLKATGISKPIVRHSTGYYLLMDLPQGEYTLTAGGKFYKQEDFLVDTKSINPKQPFKDLPLKPKANYLFPEGMTIFKGIIVDQGDKPIPKASLKIKEMNESAISEEDGNFFIQFNNIDKDKKITLAIKKDGYKAEDVKAGLKKGTVTHIGAIKLTKE